AAGFGAHDRGKKLTIAGKYVERGDTNFEGYVDEAGNNFLAHLNFPWKTGDVLLIASEGQGANKIEPVLTYEWKENPQPYDARLQSIGITNIRLKTSNGYSPHLFPEYITDWQYYYGAAPRPGFMSRFLVAENGVRAPYWPTSPNSFGGQINASSNGDLPGDIYRLIGGVVLRNKGAEPAYAGYLASAFLLPKGTGHNRVIAPGSEDLIGSDGQPARFFLVGTRPGIAYLTGSTFTPAVQIDPILPANVTFVLDYPDGRRLSVTGKGDNFGAFVGKDRWTLDVPGIYRFHLDAEWNGHKGAMPGLPSVGGDLYVLERDRPPDAPQLKLDLPPNSTFDPQLGLTIGGTSTSRSVYYAAVIPGAVVAQGSLNVRSDGKFELFFSPKAINENTATYDIANRTTGKPEIGDVVHLTFFSEERALDGKIWHSFARLILRGNRAIWVCDIKVEVTRPGGSPSSPRIGR
ncbi:MAG: hypothetical protein M1436_09635, partial [Acidobacteria bacterium]|nr:hypothetical protein [Acidobacteriota bacterium]